MLFVLARPPIERWSTRRQSFVPIFYCFASHIVRISDQTRNDDKFQLLVLIKCRYLYWSCGSCVAAVDAHSRPTFLAVEQKNFHRICAMCWQLRLHSPHHTWPTRITQRTHFFFFSILRIDFFFRWKRKSEKKKTQNEKWPKKRFESKEFKTRALQLSSIFCFEDFDFPFRSVPMRSYIVFICSAHRTLDNSIKTVRQQKMLPSSTFHVVSALYLSISTKLIRNMASMKSWRTKLNISLISPAIMRTAYLSLCLWRRPPSTWRRAHTHTQNDFMIQQIFWNRRAVVVESARVENVPTVDWNFIRGNINCHLHMLSNLL